MKNEIWKDYPEFPQHYQVSNFGRVRSKTRTINHSHSGTITLQGKLISKVIHKTGYYRVRLCVSCKKYSRSIHRMVAQTFLNNVENKSDVNHKDGDKTNNCKKFVNGCGLLTN